MNLKQFKEFESELKILEEESKGSGEIRDKKSLVYLMFIDRISVALETMRACMPKYIPDNVKETKPGLEDILKDFDPNEKIVKIFSPISDLSGGDIEKTVQAHQEIWKSLSSEISRLNKEVRRFYTLYAEQPEGKETESRVDMEKRLEKGITDAKDAFFVANTKASEFVEAAAKSYSAGAVALLKKIKNEDDLSEINSRINKFYTELKKRRDKTLFESSVYSLLLQEKFRSSGVSGVQQMSVGNVLSGLLSIYNQVKNTESIFRGTVFETEVGDSAKDYIKKTNIEEDIKFLGLNENKDKRESPEGSERIKEISGKIEKMLSSDDDISLSKWRMGISDKFESALVANEYLNDGDKKIKRAQIAIQDIVKIVGLKKQAASNDLENIIKRVKNDLKGDGEKEEGEEDARKDRIGDKSGGAIDPVLDKETGDFTETGLKSFEENAKDLLGKSEISISKDGTGENIGEVAFSLSMFTGEDYTKPDNKFDIELINRDMEIFLRSRKENPYFKIYSNL